VAAVVALALAGIVHEVRRRRPVALLLVIPAALVAAVLAPRLSPYADAKLLVILSPTIVFAAALGAFTLLRAGPRALRIGVAIAATAAACGVLASFASGYREVQLAPPDRVDAMEDAAAHADGGGLWLVNEWEEFAKYFMREIRVNAAFEAESPLPVELREPAPIFGQYFDLDDETLDYVLAFPGIIKRRSPDASRPPASYELAYRNRFYEVWRRGDGERVLEHLPLQRAGDATDRPACGAVRRLAAGADPGMRLVAARRPELVTLSPRDDVPPNWLNGPTRQSVTPTAAGAIDGSETTPAGRFRVWIQGSFGRPVEAWVDGERIGSADEIDGPGQWEEVGTVRLDAGSHDLRLRRPGFSLAPGNGVDGVLGPLALEPLERPGLVSVPPAEAERLCGREWDWIELVEG
jgi:hypothetical protein